MGYRVFLSLIAPWFLAWAAFYGYNCITCCITCTTWAALLAQTVKNPPAMQETQVRSLGREDPLENGMAPVFLPGEFHGQRSLVGSNSRTWLSD